jgi:membrane-associated PAP2 superfamily phosphatase
MAHTQRWHYIVPLIMAALLIWVYPQTGWDHALIAPYYTPQQGFFLKNHVILTLVMHDGLKTLMLLIAAGLILLLGWSWQEPNLRPHRRRLIWILLGIGLSTAAVSTFKFLSIHACPWDLALFGGYAPELPLFGSLPTGVAPGRCLPGGHASGGYALLAFYFGLLDLSKRWAHFGLAAGLLFGTAMGWAQMMRGAHFLSHNLWTLLTIWCVLLLWYSVWPPVPKSSVTHA